MRIPGFKTARAVSRWVKARFLGGAMILGYHRIASVESDEYEVCISPEHFAQQMEMLSKYARPVSLFKLVQHMKDGKIPHHSVVVTFDDGYADNFYQAKPILEKHGVPATIFVCTGYIGKEFWWDELERLVMTSAAAPRDLVLQAGDKRFPSERSIVRPGAGMAASREERREVRHALYNFLLPLDFEELSKAMNAIRNWAGGPSESPTHRVMNHDELLKLSKDGLIEIGSHTRNHPMLPHLSLQRQKDEIFQGKQDLESMLGKQVCGFAYPNGRATPDAKRIVHEAGFAYACTSLHDMVRPGSDTHELTRFWQRDVDGGKFLQGLRLWMKLHG
jgi:peptidoglycan/xylan/chitin deacetylase (PgdA/CDA1 family)